MGAIVIIDPETGRVLEEKDIQFETTTESALVDITMVMIDKMMRDKQDKSLESVYKIVVFTMYESLDSRYWWLLREQIEKKYA